MSCGLHSPDEFLNFFIPFNSYSSRRSNDDTPRFTPTHKYNAWADDRKKGGWTPSERGSPGKIIFIGHCIKKLYFE